MEQRTKTRRQAAKARKQKRVNLQEAARETKAEAWRKKHPSLAAKAAEMLDQGLPSAVVDEAVNKALDTEREDAAGKKAAEEEAANERRAESLRLEAEEKHRRYLERVQRDKLAEEARVKAEEERRRRYLEQVEQDKLAEEARVKAAKKLLRTSRTPQDLEWFERCVDVGIERIRSCGPLGYGRGREVPKDLWGRPRSWERSSWRLVDKPDIARYNKAWSKDRHAINSQASTTKWKWEWNLPDTIWVFVKEILVSVRGTGRIPVHKNHRDWDEYCQYLASEVLSLCTSWLATLERRWDERLWDDDSVLL